MICNWSVIGPQTGTDGPDWVQTLTDTGASRLYTFPLLMSGAEPRPGRSSRR